MDSQTLIREGLWFVEKITDSNGHVYFKETFLAGIDAPIKMYPFVNVAKYKDEIEKAISDYLHDNEGGFFITDILTNRIILEISQKILIEKEKQSLNKEDFYEHA